MTQVIFLKSEVAGTEAASCYNDVSLKSLEVWLLRLIKRRQ